jgi:hypothetical protein
MLADWSNKVGFRLQKFPEVLMSSTGESGLRRATGQGDPDSPVSPRDQNLSLLSTAQTRFPSTARKGWFGVLIGKAVLKKQLLFNGRHLVETRLIWRLFIFDMTAFCPASSASSAPKKRAAPGERHGPRIVRPGQ